MKIAHVVDSLEVGGAERVVLTLAERQLQRGHSVEIHYLFRTGSLQAEANHLGIPVFAADAPRTIDRIRTLAHNFAQTKPDVVHLHNATATIYGVLAALKARVPTRIATRHGLTPAPEDAFEIAAWKRESKFWAAARICHRVVAVSARAERNMRAFPLSSPSRITLVSNGAVPAAMSPTEIAVRNESFTFVHVARLHPIKDQVTLLRAFAEALHQQPDLRLILIGDGATRSELEALTATLHLGKHVLFTGETHNVGNWLAIADCFVMCSLAETTPLALLEALAADLPAIVTNVGEMPTVVHQAQCGLIVPVHSVQQLAAAMLQMVALPIEQRAQLGANAHAAYAAQYQPEAMADSYEAIYTAALARRNASPNSP